MSNTLHKQFQTFLNSLQNACIQSMDALTADASTFNHVAVLPDCPVMWSADEDFLGTDALISQSNSSPHQAAQAPSNNVVQYHYHYYSFSGFISSLVTVGAVCSGTIFLLLVWVGLVKVQSTLSPATTVENGQTYAELESTVESISNLYI
ncbi:MAG: hypothetical protein WBA57_20730 [Elainellaceae cyanobacterium]